MSHCRLPLFIATVLLCPVLALSDAADVGPRIDDVLRLLDKHEVIYPEEEVRRAAIAGLLKAIDSHARLMDSKEAETMEHMASVAKAEMWPGDIGYVKLQALCGGGGEDTGKVIRDWDGASRGLVLDLRGGAGADLESVEMIAGLFLGPGTNIYHLVNGYDEAVETRATRGGPLNSIPPLMLLVDGNTSGAAEALVAVLKGRGGIMVLGEKTAGDALSREIVPVAKGLSAYIATRGIRPVKGPEYRSSGVPPDIVVPGAAMPVDEESQEDSATVIDKGMEIGEFIEQICPDPVLRRAVDILLSLEAMSYGRPEPAGEEGVISGKTEKDTPGDK